jgi:proteasome lid subunit RPN8/RPN11
MLTLLSSHSAEIIRHAQAADPHECCGLIGGNDSLSGSIYKLNNVASNSLVTYEASPEELFAAQRAMRERGETLLAIYHSHPRASEPFPSDTDVRLAYYPDAIYLIIGLAGGQPILRAFQISEKDRTWQQVEYAISDL